MTTNETPAAAPQNDDLPGQISIRLAKRQKMIDEGIEPYPVELPVTTTIPELREKYGSLEAGVELADVAVGIAGRVMLSRSSGKIAFATLQDGPGNRIQVLLSLANVGEEAFARFKTDVDLGDHLFVEGYVGTSKRGELSVFARSWQIASKAIRPLPKVYTNADGEDVTLSEESRVRMRHLDLIMRPAARDMVRLRAGVMKSLRANFDDRGYLELETPMLQAIHGGAAARPFVTHINAYNQDLYLRIATELYLKRAVVGGVDKVFEINRNFRNEGADSSHSPEFTAIEAYEAYATYDTMAELTQSLVQRACLDTLGTTTVTLSDGTEYDLGGQWARIDLYTSISEAVGEEVTVETPREKLEAIADRRGENRRGDLRRARRLETVGADLRSRLPGGHVAPYPASPFEARTDREMGPVRARDRAGDGILRACRPGDPTRAFGSPVVGGRQRRPRSHAARRRIHRGPRAGLPAVRRHGDGRRSTFDRHDGPRHPGNDHVPVRAPARQVTTKGL